MELAVTLEPVTCEALLMTKGPIRVPPTAPPKEIVPAPAVRVTESAPAVASIRVELKEIFPPDELRVKGPLIVEAPVN